MSETGWEAFLKNNISITKLENPRWPYSQDWSPGACCWLGGLGFLSEWSPSVFLHGPLSFGSLASASSQWLVSESTNMEAAGPPKAEA